MDALQIIASATQIVGSMVGAVSALEQASRDLSEAPKRIRTIEEFVSELDNLSRHFRQKHAHKLHNPQLDSRMQSLDRLIERLHDNIRKARRIVPKSKTKSLAKVVWSSMVGDPLSKVIQSMQHDLNWWLELQKLSDNVEKVLVSTAKNMNSLFRINVEQGYPMPRKCYYVRKILEQDNSNRVILIVGLSGIGKSCLARQIASDPPGKFVDGAVEIGFGQWCSRAACNGNRTEYHKRLTKRIFKFLLKIGFVKANDVVSRDLEDVCCLLQTSLVGKSILVLLDDVWEQDIVERFAKLYDNGCKFLVTTRNEAVYEITEAEKVEICKDDIREISKEILLYHSLLSNEELPSVGETLLDRCGHHPLTVAVMGKALRKETSEEKWEKAICNLSTYASCAPGPVSYVNEKDAENTLTIFGSFEFSLEVMPEQSHRFFTVLAVISWAEPVPEACLESLWSVLVQDTIFPLVVCKLVEGSLLIKMDFQLLYHVHDMVSLYLDNKIDEAIKTILIECSPDDVASIAPWLFIFGKEKVQIVAEEKMTTFLTVLSQERQVVNTLENIVHSLMASKSISEFEFSRKSFRRVLGPKVSSIVSAGAPSLIVAVAHAITTIFSQEDYYEYVISLEDAGAVDRLTELLGGCNDPSTLTIVSTVAAKLAEHGSIKTIDKILSSMPMNKLAELLAPDAEEFHESVFATLISLTKAGKSKAVEGMIASGINKNLLLLLESGSEFAQHHAIITLKTFYELGVPLEQEYFSPKMLNLLPWHSRLILERFVMSDRSLLTSPKPLAFDDILHNILDTDSEQVTKAMQELIPIIEKASEPRIRDMILESHLIERLATLLQHGESEGNRARSESAFLLMKLACAGGEPFILKFLEFDIILELVKMMQCDNEELQDSAYTALHEIVSGRGGAIVVNRCLQMGLIEKLVQSQESPSLKEREVSMHFLMDLVEVGTKACVERMLTLHVIEKLVRSDRIGGSFRDSVLRFLKGLDMSKHLSVAERRMMKQQVVKKVRAAVRSRKMDSSLIAKVEAYVSETSRGASSSKQRR